MSTQSYIAVKRNDGKYYVSYCHSDGYYEGVGRMLVEHYKDYAKIVALSELGDLSILAPSIECPAGHSFETPVKGYTIAYGRDRNEVGCEAACYETLGGLLIDYNNEPFLYIYMGGEWKSFVSVKTLV